jgi:hypothetical protein
MSIERLPDAQTSILKYSTGTQMTQIEKMNADSQDLSVKILRICVICVLKKSIIALYYS